LVCRALLPILSIFRFSMFMLPGLDEFDALQRRSEQSSRPF
jgi:hypothetical protein